MGSLQSCNIWCQDGTAWFSEGLSANAMCGCVCTLNWMWRYRWFCVVLFSVMNLGGNLRWIPGKRVQVLSLALINCKKTSKTCVLSAVILVWSTSRHVSPSNITVTLDVNLKSDLPQAKCSAFCLNLIFFRVIRISNAMISRVLKQSHPDLQEQVISFMSLRAGWHYQLEYLHSILISNQRVSFLFCLRDKS